MKRSAPVFAVVLAVVFFAPALACGAARTTSVVRVQTGPQIASQSLSQVGGICFGASGATVSVGAQGHRRNIHIDLGELTSTSQGSSTGLGLLELAILAPLAGAVLRFLTFLARLGGR